MQIEDRRPPKLCFAKAGDVVQFVNEKGGADGPPYLVVMAETKALPPSLAEKGIMSNGLYSDPRPYFLVDLSKGTLISMPNLSIRAHIISSATLILT